MVPEPDGLVGAQRDGVRAEPMSLRLDPLDKATPYASVAEWRDDTDHAHGHRAIVIAERQRAADDIPVDDRHKS